MKAKLDNSTISTHLGSRSDYKSTYDASLLVREPRQGNRKHLELDDDNLPFVGYDIWNAYEVSGLTKTGVPVTGFAKVRYPCTNKYIVESKSIKLYFNSFNMTQLGDSPKQVRETIEYMSSRDLSDLLETNVEVTIFDTTLTHISETIFTNYITLEDNIDTDSLVCDTYTETPGLLEVIDTDPGEEGSGIRQLYHSSLLKSNCRVTSQPDWGDVYISMTSHLLADKESLLKYIVSFRDECHFHEEICETIYKRLSDVYSPSELCVSCLYVRRGGIDINPVRASSSEMLLRRNIVCITDMETPFPKTSRQ
jgi:7-cyano-7-deazaguanine reductase